MKRKKDDFYERIIAVDNLTLADNKAQIGKKKQYSVIRHNKNKEANIIILNEVLEAEEYKTTPYYIFKIREPKERIISRLDYYPNRIVHWAIMLQLEPEFVDCFISQSYSCIKGRGIHKCSNDLTAGILEEGEDVYCLQIDIRKFFPSVDKEILKVQLSRKFKDKRLLRLLSEIIDSNPNGLPLGNLLSQWFGNFYLNPFDHWLKEKIGIRNYFRYCDDGVILHNDKAFLHSLRKQIQEYLAVNLHLELSNYQVYLVRSRGIDIGGYRHFGKYKLIRRTIKYRFIRMVRRRDNPKSRAAYWGWIKHCNGKNLWKKYSNAN